ncbi:Meckelin [Boothiomyces sp. JEL0866]|nr:Meckelin [Boothiomyces sp. JEL0866]
MAHFVYHAQMEQLEADIFLDRNSTGGPLTTGICSSCPQGYYPSPDYSTCLSCPSPVEMIPTYDGSSYSCSCSSTLGYTLIDGQCVSTSVLQSVQNAYGSTNSYVTIPDLIDSSGNSQSVWVQSDVFQNNFLPVTTKCQMGDVQACQYLGNLCVMALYSTTHYSCKAYTTLASLSSRAPVLSDPFNDQPNGMPWLYWGLLSRETSQSIRKRIPTISLKITQPSQPLLQFVLGVYTVNGTFLGFQNVTTQLQACPFDYSYGLQWQQPGVGYNNTCTISLSKKTFDPTLFYEIFLVQSTGAYYPVPVRIITPSLNVDSAPTDQSSFYRRFALVDTTVGIQNGVLKYIRFPKTIKIWINVVSGTDADMQLFLLALIAIAGLELIHIAREFYKQCTVDIFFIDWEQPKVLESNNTDQSSIQPISFWRTILMSNQWAKLQLYRKASIDLTVFGIVTLMQGAGLRNISTLKPNIGDISSGVINPLLLFASNALVWMLLDGVQTAFKFLLQERFYRNTLSQYADVLSLSNISLLLLDEKCHGYYIHGKSVHSTADTDMEELNNCLKKETNDLVPRRGLADTNQQIFEVFLNLDFRKLFDKIKSNTQPDTTRTLQMMQRLSSQTLPLLDSNKNEKITAWKQMQKFLKTFLESNLKEYSFTIKEKTFIEKIAGAIPDTSKGPVFMNDQNGIIYCLLYGLETHLMIFYISLYSALDYWSNPVLAGFAVWAIDKLLCGLRIWLGERNIAIKGHLDSKYLLG